MNVIDRLPQVLNEYPSQVRTAAIAVVPALIVFIIMVSLRPAPPPPAPAVPVDVPFTHVFTKADFDVVSGLTLESNQLIQGITPLASHPANANQSACLNGLKEGVYSYVSTVLVRMRVDVASSISMRNAEDEKYLNGNMAGSLTNIMSTMPALFDATKKVISGCPNDAVVAVNAQKVQTLLGKMALLFANYQQRLGKK